MVAIPAQVATVGGSIFHLLWYIAVCLVFIELICWAFNIRGPLRWCYAAITSRFKPKQTAKTNTQSKKTKKKSKSRKKNRR